MPYSCVLYIVRASECRVVVLCCGSLICRLCVASVSLPRSIDTSTSPGDLKDDPPGSQVRLRFASNCSCRTIVLLPNRPQDLSACCACCLRCHVIQRSITPRRICHAFFVPRYSFLSLIM